MVVSALQEIRQRRRGIVENTFLKNLLSPYFRANLIIMILFAAILTYFQVWVGVVAFVVIIGICFYHAHLVQSRKELLGDYVETVTSDLENTVRPILLNNPLPLCLVDSHGVLIWFNQRFSDIYPEGRMFNSVLAELTGLRLGDFESPEEGESLSFLEINREDQIYKVIATVLDGDMKGNTMLYWMDVTELKNLQHRYGDEQICHAHIIVDNYDELIASSPDERKSIIAAQIETAIRQWVGRMATTAVKYRSDRYFVVFQEQYYRRLEAGKFSILDEIRSIETDADFPASLSIGIGKGGKTLSENEEYALSALDLALGRGGDQAVVRKRSRVEYYGGKLQTVEKRNKGKSRIMAHALLQMIDQSDCVIVMGHKNPDLDSLGAALGIWRMAENRDKEAYVVINEVTGYMAPVIEQVTAANDYHLISGEEAMELISRDTLLVVVDTHRTSLVECPELLNLTDKIMVIDHHRKTEDCIENATLTYMESYASSASELVTEIFTYMGGGKKPVDRLEAELLLAGISLDTKNFSIRTGVRTFEAASWLRRNGAELSKVKQFFQVDEETMKQKSLLIANAEVLPGGIALTSGEGVFSSAQIIAAQAADELLNLQGVRASFAILRNDSGKTVVSARSLGEINVQTLLEKLGGGGHLSMAGAQTDLSLEETIRQVKDLISEIGK